MVPLLALLLASTAQHLVAAPTGEFTTQRYYDVQGHRGGRGETTENTLPAFAQ